MNKKLILLFLLITVFSLYSQDQPKIGSLVFESYKFIGNKHLKPSEAEIVKNKRKLREFVKNNIDSEKTDDFINSIPKSEFAVFGDTMKCSYKLDVYKNFYESRTECEYIKEKDTEIYDQINRETLEISAVVRTKSTNKYKIVNRRKIKLPSVPKNYELIEYRNETKLILGYKCFKVLMRQKSKHNPNFPFYDFELYVTEEINLNYNPISRYKQILGKYYPLEITKKPRKEIMTEFIIWRVKNVDL
ncbi:hypothetical protein [Kordia sp.]|uniref:hypothetical protein n=1 Tax=Kordia sp. TaxID=1965332 RepID=UPI003B5CFE70